MVGMALARRDYTIEVLERPGQPGRFSCAIHLKPHHQLDDIGAGFRLVTQIQPQRAAA